MISHQEFIISQASNLCKDGLYDSADILLQCLISKDITSPDLCLMYAKIMAHKGEHMRAIYYFQYLLQKMSDKVSLELQNLVKVKIGDSYLKIAQPLEALQVLQTIPESSRGIKVMLTMANLHRILKQPRYARNLYLEILKKNPLAIEASIALTQLGYEMNQNVKVSDIKSFVKATNQENQKAIQQISLLNDNLIRGHSLFYQAKFNEALQFFSQVQNTHKRHLHALQHIALCNTRLDSLDKAKYSFELLRSFDGRYMNSMDVYGNIIKSEGKVMELNKLTHELLKIDRLRSECWVVMALYCELKGLKNDAAVFVEKAVNLALGKLSEAHSIIIRGELQLLLKRPSQAVESFLQAYTIEKSLIVYRGLVHSYVEMRKFEEALRYAREAWEKIPNNPQSLTLLGAVLMNTPVEDGRVKARKCLDKALDLDPHCFDAVMTLADLNVAEQKLPEAIELLNKHKEHEQKKLEYVYNKLGDISVLSNNFAEAMIHYHNALQINPHLQSAKDGLDILEKQLNRLKADSDEDEVLSASGSELEDSFDSFL